MADALKIRRRERRGYMRETGRHGVWTEWQVVEGRKIVRRFDRSQAKEFCKKLGIEFPGEGEEVQW